MRSIELSVVVALLLTGSGCSRDEERPGEGTAPESRPTVYAVNYPLAYFAERIGGDFVTIEFPAPPDVDPAFWNPEPEVVARYQDGDLILLNGAAYAKWTDKVSLPASTLVPTSASFDDRLILVEGALTHSHGPGGEHAHEGTAFTTWLDPNLAIEHAEAIRAALEGQWPEQAPRFQQGFDGLRQDLQDLDRRLEATTARYPGIPLLASHPVYQYLARRYDLNLRSVQWEPDELPGQADWLDLSRITRSHSASWMLWEANPLPETTERLRQRGVESVVFDQCGNRPAEGDYLTVMEQNIRNLDLVFGGER
jgi:zinc transport system substrate-binding protein